MIVERSVRISEPSVPDRLDPLRVIASYAASIAGIDPSDEQAIAPYAIIGTGVAEHSSAYWRWGVVPGMYDTPARAADRLEVRLVRARGSAWPLILRGEGIFAEERILDETYARFSALLDPLY